MKSTCTAFDAALQHNKTTPLRSSGDQSIEGARAMRRLRRLYSCPTRNGFGSPLLVVSAGRREHFGLDSLHAPLS